MGIFIKLDIIPSKINSSDWNCAYAECLQLVKAYPFMDRIFDEKTYNCTWIYADRTQERELSFCNNNLGFHTIGDMTTMKTAEGFELVKDIGYYSLKHKSPSEPVDVLFSIVASQYEKFEKWSVIRVMIIRNCKFKVMEGLTLAGAFSEVTGVMDMSVDVVEYRDGLDDGIFTKLAGNITKYGNITFKKGAVLQTLIEHNFYSWIKKCITNRVKHSDKKDLIINAVDSDDITIIASWEVSNAWPIKYSLSEFNAMSSEILIETLEVACDRCTRLF